MWWSWHSQEKPEVGAEFKSMKAVDLQHACQARGLNSDGTKAQLIRKLTVRSCVCFLYLYLMGIMQDSWNEEITWLEDLEVLRNFVL